MSVHGMCVRDRYSQLSAAQVDSFVRDIVHSHPHSGYRLVQSYVNATIKGCPSLVFLLGSLMMSGHNFLDLQPCI